MSAVKWLGYHSYQELDGREQEARSPGGCANKLKKCFSPEGNFNSHPPHSVQNPPLPQPCLTASSHRPRSEANGDQLCNRVHGVGGLFMPACPWATHRTDVTELVLVNGD